MPQQTKQQRAQEPKLSRPLSLASPETVYGAGAGAVGLVIGLGAGAPAAGFGASAGLAAGFASPGFAAGVAPGLGSHGLAGSAFGLTPAFSAASQPRCMSVALPFRKRILNSTRRFFSSA